MTEQFANNASSTLNGAINNSTTTIVVTSAASFPSVGNFRLLLGTNPASAEIVLVTGVSGTTFTVLRAQESTTASSWPDLTTVTHILTAAAVDQIRTQFVTVGGEAYTTKAISIDGGGTLPSDHGSPQLYVNGPVLANSFSVGEIPLTTLTYDYVSDSNQSFTVPAGVTQLLVKMWGPGGGTGNYNSGYGGASGGYSTGFLSVTPGETLVLAVGSGGKKSVSSSGNGGVGGWPNGGSGGRGDASAGGGGGLTGIFSASYSQANALMLAGGGGGSSGYTGGLQPGAGGGSSGNDGNDTTSGKGGTQIFGGFGGGPAVYTVTSTTGGTYEVGVTDIGNHTDDSPITTIALPFNFVFYGVSYSSIGISSNGFVIFNSTDTTYAWDIPGTARPPTIALWNRDNTTSGGDRGWYTKTIGSAPSRTFVMEYRGYQLSTTNTINAELKIYEGSTTFEVLYSTSTSTDTTGTIGIQDNLGAHYTVFNNNTAPPAAGTRLVYTQDAGIAGKSLAGGSAFTDVTTSTSNDAGGGGSGYFGGGAGQGDGRQGGGGSGYLHPTRVTNGSTTAGTNGAIGAVGAAPPSTTDTSYTSGIGVGGAATGTGSDGGNGRVVIKYGDSSNFDSHSVTLANSSSITAPIGNSDLNLNTTSGGSIVLNPDSGLVTLQGTSALNSTADLILSYTNSLKVSSSSANKFRVFSTGAVNIGEATNNDTSSEAQAGLTGPLINISSGTGSITTVTNQATIFNQSGALNLQGNTDVRFNTGATLRGYFDSNGIFRAGPSATSTATMQGASWPVTGTDYFWMYNSTSSCWAEIVSGGSTARSALQVFNNAASNTIGVALYGPGGSHATAEYAGNGVIEQSGNSTSALVFTKRDGTTGASFASTGAIWQSGAWTIGRSTTNDTSSEAQAGLTGPLLNITQTTGGTVTAGTNQALLYNIAGVATLQGTSGHNFITGTTSIASTNASRFITSQGRRAGVTTTTTNLTVLDTHHNIFVGTLSGSITLTLPSTPTTGDTYLIKDRDGSATAFNIVISGNGKNIEQFTGAAAASLTLNQNYDSVTIMYNGTFWSIV